jgi:hypothetical protein
MEYPAQEISVGRFGQGLEETPFEDVGPIRQTGLAQKASSPAGGVSHLDDRSSEMTMFRKENPKEGTRAASDIDHSAGMIPAVLDQEPCADGSGMLFHLGIERSSERRALCHFLPERLPMDMYIPRFARLN